MAVTPREDGALFAVTLGPPPQLFTFRVVKPPKLGERVSVEGTVRATQPIAGGRGSTTSLDAARVEVIGSVRRYVDDIWIARVQAAMARPLLPYQVDGAAWLATRLFKGVGAILGDDMGLGKTAQAIAAVAATHAFPAVIVCPSAVKGQWHEEFRYAAEPWELHVVEGRYGPLPSAHCYILNYAILKHRAEQLAVLAPRLYIFDEAQNLKQPKPSGRHRAAIATKLVRRTGGALLLTGTPVMNRPIELWRLLHLAEPKQWPSLEAYTVRYCQPKKGKERGRSLRTAAGRIERIDELHAAIAPCMLRRLKGDVLTELPPKHRRTALVALGAEELAHYRKAESDVVAWLRDVGQDKRAVNAARSPGLTRLTYLRRIAAVGKLRGAVPSYLQAFLERYPGEPLVVFGYHRDVMLGLWHMCQRLGVSATGIGGSESYQKRQERIATFQQGSAQIFLAPIAVGGVGLNLQRAAHALFVERIWTPSGMAQAEDRVHRLGQTRAVTITYLDAQHTVDEHIAEVLEEKQRLIDAVVDDRSQSAESFETVLRVMGRLREAG